MTEVLKKPCCVPEEPRETPCTIVAPAVRRSIVGHIPSRFVRLDGGAFHMGTDERILPADGEYPSRRVQVSPLAIDPYAVTNEWFAAFVAATGYATDAERFGWSYVFAGLLPEDHPPTLAVNDAPWWRRVQGARWRHPEGPGSSIATRMDQPVVHVSWSDAQAFAAWAGARLPTEAEWEFAARGGLDRRRFPWGDGEPGEEENLFCNIWQGSFPGLNTAADGFVGTAPVHAFAPNAYGLFNMVGNVWEWCSDLFRVRSLKRALKARDRASLSSDSKVMKGGSYLCHRSYCYRYRVAARVGIPADTSTGHTGFRVAFS
jgi:formylglycine-generating enzyme